MLQKKTTIKMMFLISAPIYDCDESSWLKLKAVAFNFATFSKIQTPKFRIAPKSELYELSKDMLQLDHSVENLFRFLLSTFEDVLQQEGVDLLEHLITQKQLYGGNITNFSWDVAKYSPYLFLSDLCHLFYKHFHELDQQMRSNVATYKENLKVAAEYIIAEETLATQNLARCVYQESVIDTEYIQSVYVAVPRQLATKWLEVYETLHDSVVSCSSCFITEDNDYKLYAVVIIRKGFLEFRDNCAKNGFIAREYQSDQDGFARKLHEQRKLEEATQYQNVMLIQWLKVISDDLFELLLHIKLFRAYVGSLLRYGQNKFQTIMFYPRKNSSQRLQIELRKLYEKQDEKNETITNRTVQQKQVKQEGNFLPYLIYKVDLGFPEY
uniref:V-type proton ATPase subunit C n=1 Tax=Setaria digitata TaxID=48799 RepID=A0A915PK89_9BILA